MNEMAAQLSEPISKFKNCAFCGEEILVSAIKCKHCGEFTDGRATPKQGPDELSGGWIALIWLSLIIPYIGGFIIIVLSSVLYYSWKKHYPKKANSINKHAWLAFLCSFLIWFCLIGSMFTIF